MLSLLDVSAVLDTVDHEILVTRLWTSYGFAGLYIVHHHTYESCLYRLQLSKIAGHFVQPPVEIFWSLPWLLFVNTTASSTLMRSSIPWEQSSSLTLNSAQTAFSSYFKTLLLRSRIDNRVHSSFVGFLVRAQIHLYTYLNATPIQLASLSWTAAAKNFNVAFVFQTFVSRFLFTVSVVS